MNKLQSVVEQIVSDSKMFVKRSENKAEIYFYTFFNLDEYIQLADKYSKAIVKELRGLTFCNNKAYPSISKFFNLDEHQYAIKFDDLPDKVLAYEKLDGSLISPVLDMENDGKLMFKSKTTFNSKQALMAMKLKDSKYPKLESEIKRLIELENIYPQFELISPANRIVVPYTTDELVLIALRYWNAKTQTFDYITEPKVMEDIAKRLGVRMARYEVMDKDELLYRQQNETGVEGWVLITPIDLVKVKTKWYFERHSLYSSLENELKLFELVLNEKLDDLVSILTDEYQKQAVIEYAGKIQSYLNNLANELIQLYREWLILGDKEFALKHRSKTKYLNLFRQHKSDFEQSLSSIVKALVKKVFKKRSDVIKEFGSLNLKN